MTEEIYEKLIQCENMSMVEDILDTLEMNKDYEFCDEGYDETIDDEDSEDDFIQYRTYYFYINGKDKPYYTKYYYGNYTWKIGFVF